MEPESKILVLERGERIVIPLLPQYTPYLESWPRLPSTSQRL